MIPKMNGFLDPYDNCSRGFRVFGWLILAVVLLIALVFFTEGCTPLVGGHQVITKEQVYSPTGTYNVYDADCATVQSKYLQYGGNPRMTVEACTVWTKEGRREIWYCTERGWEEELFNVRSYRNLIRAHRYDERR